MLLAIASCAVALICFIVWSIRRCWWKCRSSGSQILIDAEIDIESDLAEEVGRRHKNGLEIV